jgi:hypothetical protein
VLLIPSRPDLAERERQRGDKWTAKADGDAHGLVTLAAQLYSRARGRTARGRGDLLSDVGVHGPRGSAVPSASRGRSRAPAAAGRSGSSSPSLSLTWSRTAPAPASRAGAAGVSQTDRTPREGASVLNFSPAVRAEAGDHPQLLRPRPAFAQAAAGIEVRSPPRAENLTVSLRVGSPPRQRHKRRKRLSSVCEPPTTLSIRRGDDAGDNQEISWFLLHRSRGRPQGSKVVQFVSDSLREVL